MSQQAHLDRMNYYGDARVRESMKTRYFEVIAVHGGVAIVQLTDDFIEIVLDEGDRPEWLPEGHDGAFPAKVLTDACWQCGGKGTMVNPSIDAGGISGDVFDDDPDFREAYFSGAYDVTCSACRGNGHSREVQLLDERVQAVLDEWEADDAAHAAECAAERRMGC